MDTILKQEQDISKEDNQNPLHQLSVQDKMLLIEVMVDFNFISQRILNHCLNEIFDADSQFDESFNEHQFNESLRENVRKSKYKSLSNYDSHDLATLINIIDYYIQNLTMENNESMHKIYMKALIDELMLRKDIRKQLDKSNFLSPQLKK